MKIKKNSDYSDVPEKYREFHDEIFRVLPSSRLFSDPFRTLAYGTDASFYRLIPKIVIKAVNRDEVSAILQIANRIGIPVTFRAAGTSLSGQAVTDSVLIVLSGAWKNYSILDSGQRITLEPGVIGAEANLYLGPYGRKIGPDPASINSCMIGGIAANNASGMCCGTAQNSYNTVESMKIILYDGSVLDTSDIESRLRFRESHGMIIEEIEAIRREIESDPRLRRRIIDKYRIKNTTGYSINSFVDYKDPIDIILHLMIGSEGTLGFISEVTYRTVVEHAHKSSALFICPDIENACRATMILKNAPVSAVELMDRASLRSVENKTGMPPYLKSLGGHAAALLVETRAGDSETLLMQVEEIKAALHPVPSLFPLSFTDKKDEYEKLWDIRRGLFPAIGGARKIGTTVIIEDVAFPIEKLAHATLDIQGLMRRHGYDEGIIFGHALNGNLHFVFTQDFGIPEEVKRYQRFMDEVCMMVVDNYDGSLKGEHGTGRNMAPFVELEWGEKAYSLMRRIKKAFDPQNLLNPGVILDENRFAHVENLKPLPQTNEIVDRCIECGFCEVKCPSRNLTTTPRQRIAIRREISRLTNKLAGAASSSVSSPHDVREHRGQAAMAQLNAAQEKDVERLRSLEKDYVYFGEETCAADGLCATACPVSINTGDLTKYLRSLQNSRKKVLAAQWIVDHYPAVTAGIGLGLKAANAMHSLLGTSLMSSLTRGARALSGNKIPLWNPHMPKGVSAPVFRGISKGSDRKVVYFPSCVVRTMGPSRNDKDQKTVFEAMLSVLDKAGYDVLFPEEMKRLCCGIPLESKGFFEQADQMSRELETALLACSNEGQYPVLCDTSPCLYRMRRAFRGKLNLYEPVEFIHTFLMDRLDFRKVPETVAVHVTCSSIKMGLNEKFKALAEACAEKVVMPLKVGCCGFAGDKGFTHPELNQSALEELKASLPRDCRSGYSNSRTCEIGLSLHSGVGYQSLVYLVDRCTEKTKRPRIVQQGEEMLNNHIADLISSPEIVHCDQERGINNV